MASDGPRELARVPTWENGLATFVGAFVAVRYRTYIEYRGVEIDDASGRSERYGADDRE